MVDESNDKIMDAESEYQALMNTDSMKEIDKERAGDRLPHIISARKTEVTSAVSEVKLSKIGMHLD